jgi:catechol 2,3-dioxygenase-like lactoylglutathione lyase family enzyme
MSEVVSGLRAVTVHVRDLAKAREFYTRVLGLHEVTRDPASPRLVFALPASSTVLTMHVQAPGEGGRDPGTVSGLVFHHPDPRAAAELIRQRGGTITLEPTLVEIAGAKFHRTAFSDPDGNEFLISNRAD